MGGKLHPKLISGERSIAHKYPEGNMKRTLERELTVPEIAIAEASYGYVGSASWHIRRLLTSAMYFVDGTVRHLRRPAL